MADARGRAGLVRRVVGSSLVLGLLVSAVAFYRLAPALPRTPPRPPEVGATTATRAPSPSSTADPTPTDTPTSSATPSPTPTPSRSTTPRGLPDGPGRTSAGILLVATPASDGSFDVAELVRFDDPVTRLTVRTPRIDRAGGLFRRSRAVAEEVQISAGDQPVVLPDARVDRTVRLDVPAVRRLALRYRLTGVTKRTVPSSAGRALATIGPLVDPDRADFPVMIVVTGSSVRNLTCPLLRLSEQSCSAGSAPRVRLARALPAKNALAQVQLDLPMPR